MNLLTIFLDQDNNMNLVPASYSCFSDFFWVKTKFNIILTILTVLQVVLFTVLWFKWSVEQHYAAKILSAICVIFQWKWKDLYFHENIYTFYKFSYICALIPFLSFLKNQKIRIKFSTGWWSGNKKYSCFLFIASRTLLQLHAEFNRRL